MRTFKRFKIGLPTLMVLVGCCVNMSAPAQSIDGVAIKRVVFVGDSITCGAGLKKQSDRFSSVTVALLREKYPEIEEVNLCRGGKGLFQHVGDNHTEILAKKPDAVVIQWGVNDFYWGQSVANFTTNYDFLVRSLREKEPELLIVVTTLIPDIRWEGDGTWTGEANVALQEIAVKYGCRVAYTHAALNHDRKYYSDTIHPNKDGAAQMASAIVNAFESVSQKRDHFDLQFDAVEEARIENYVFKPTWSSSPTELIRIEDITKTGMKILSASPLSVRTPSIYQPTTTYQISVTDEVGKVISTDEIESGWSGVIRFDVQSALGNQHVEIRQIKT